MKHLITTYTQAILLMALMLLVPSAMWAEKQAYAQYADGTLTFRYDENRQSFKVTYALPTSGNDPGWWPYYKEITKVVFDESFKDARPVNLGKWFLRECNLTEITNIEYLNTSEATDMSSMFSGCTSLTSLDLRTFNTENVTKMASMFFDCSALTSLDVTSFNTQKVEDMTSMFSNCLALSELNLPSFNTPNVTNMTGMFAHDVSLSSIKVTSRFAMDQVTSSDNMFFDCSKLPGFNSNYTDKTKASSYLTFLALQPWAEYQKDTRTLTFRYDAMKDYVTATAKYDLPASGSAPDWLAHQNDITTVVFDEYFKEVRPVRCHKWFYKMLSLTDIIGLEYLNTSEVNDMSYMFSECRSLTPQDLSHFCTDNVTTMTYMFYGCTSWTAFDLSSFNTQKVDDMSYMFYDCGFVTELDLSSFDTPKVTDMSYMFYNCKNLTTLDISSFDTQKVTDMSYMFCKCKKLTALDVTSFKTPNVTNIAYMFYDCGCVTELDLSSFDTQKVTNMEDMFAFDEALTHIYASDLFVTDQVTRSNDMFRQCTHLPGYKASEANDQTMAPVYLTYIPVKPWVEYQEATQTLTFHYDNIINTVAATAKYELPTVGNSPKWLDHQEDIKTVVFENHFKDVHPKSLEKWFYSMVNLTDIQGMEYLSTDSVTDMSWMFYDCRKLSTIDLSHFNTANVTTLDIMFSGCESLTQLDLSSFDTEQVTDMGYMFSNCPKLTTLDLSSFDTQKVTFMSFMFKNDAALTHIYVSKSFILDQVDVDAYMFEGCVKLPNFDANYTGKTKAHLYLTYIQPWADYQADTKTLTFHNDRKQAAVKATAQYELPAAGVDPGWLAYKDDITTVVFAESFKNARPVRCAKWFYDMISLTDIQGMEYLCTDSVNDMSNMFYNCVSLTSLDLSHFNTSEVTTMTYMFYTCAALTELDVTSFNTQKVDDMSEMFYRCGKLTSLDLSSFDTRKVTNMEYMFFSDALLAHIYVSDLFATDLVTQSNQMFYLCRKLPHFGSSVGKEKAHYDEAEGGYLTLRRKISVGETRYNVDGYVSPMCYDDVTFTDGAAYTSPCNFTFADDKKASYTRAVSNHWATLCLPFAYSAENSTAKFYGVESYTDGNIAVTALTGPIAAGTPILAYVTDGELSVTATGAAAVAEAKQLSELKGAFQQTEVADEDYIIANDHFWNAGWLKTNNDAAQHVYVAPYRASLTLSSTEAKPNSISISENETDGIDGAASIENLLDGAELYDLQGRRLSAPQHGVIIIRKDGVSRKVVVK